MNITPERILELAEWAEDTASYFDTTDEHGYIICEAEEEKQIYLQISACLKSYAEILPKWQALLNAEPVAYGLTNTAITGNPHALMVLAIEIPPNGQYGGALWHPLIIKPAPEDCKVRPEAL